MTPAATVAMQTVINTGCIECNTPSNPRVASVRSVSAHCVVVSESSKMFGGATRVSKHIVVSQISN